MAAIGADYYAGNCHKWLQSPKGCGFLYAAANKQVSDKSRFICCCSLFTRRL
jgi:glutamate/tyrosine decarboxylase-like PLP-dependent enzyme